MVFLKGNGEFKTAINIGVASFQIKAEITLTQIVEKFDACLYRAKENERNHLFPLLEKEMQ